MASLVSSKTGLLTNLYISVFLLATAYVLPKETTEKLSKTRSKTSSMAKVLKDSRWRFITT